MIPKNVFLQLTFLLFFFGLLLRGRLERLPLYTNTPENHLV
jgi:hypothetical protein